MVKILVWIAILILIYMYGYSIGFDSAIKSRIEIIEPVEVPPPAILHEVNPDQYLATSYA